LRPIEELWQGKAMCTGKSQMFDILKTEGKPYSEQKKIKAENTENFRKAEILCSYCPVIEQCYQTATEDDLAYTYRAGLVPTNFNPAVRGRPVKPFEPAKDLSGKECSKGHVGFYAYRTREGRRVPICMECKRINDRRNWAEREAAKPKPPPAPEIPMDQRECPNGHLGFYKVYADGKPRCSECRTYAFKKSRSGKMNA